MLGSNYKTKGNLMYTKGKTLSRADYGRRKREYKFDANPW